MAFFGSSFGIAGVARIWPLAAMLASKKLVAIWSEQRTYGHAMGSLEMTRVTRFRHREPGFRSIFGTSMLRWG